MSFITGKPFVDRALQTLTKSEEISRLISVVNNSASEPLGTYILYTVGSVAGKALNSIIREGKEFEYVNLSYNRHMGDIRKGFLFKLSNTEYAFLTFENHSKIMSTVSLKTDGSFGVLHEELTTEEFRRCLGDLDDVNIGPDGGKSVPSNQATTTVIVNPLTNLNGRVLSAFEANLVTESGYTYYIITKDSEKLSKEQAADYMEYMSGSRFVPVYDYEKPQNSMFITPDGKMWKPQYDDTNGMRLYYMSGTGNEARVYEFPAGTELTQAIHGLLKTGDIIVIQNYPMRFLIGKLQDRVRGVNISAVTNDNVTFDSIEWIINGNLSYSTKNVPVASKLYKHNFIWDFTDLSSTANPPWFAGMVFEGSFINSVEWFLDDLLEEPEDNFEEIKKYFSPLMGTVILDSESDGLYLTTEIDTYDALDIEHLFIALLYFGDLTYNNITPFDIREMATSIDEEIITL